MDKNIGDKAIDIIDSQIQKLSSFKEPFQDNVPQWKDRTIRMLKALILTDELDMFANIEHDNWETEIVAYAKILYEIKEGIKESPEFFLIQSQLEPPKTNNNPSKQADKIQLTKKVFLVHGHDSLAKTEVARLLEKLGLEPIILHEQANEGKTIIEKFERDASQVSFAVILMTPDDVGYPKKKSSEAKPRARQNVILELGYFSGILGREKVCVLYKSDVEIPSDYLGVIYVPFDNNGAWKFNLAKELKQVGMEIDMNRLI